MAALLLLISLAGPVILGTAVARTIGTNVIDLGGQGELGYVLIVLSSLSVVLLSWRVGIPTSMTLALGPSRQMVGPRSIGKASVAC